MTAIIANPRERTRFFRFLVVGTIGAVVDFGIENLLHRVFGVPYVWAGTISFICAMASTRTAPSPDKTGIYKRNRTIFGPTIGYASGRL